MQALRDLRYMLENPSQDKRVAKFLRNLLYMTETDDSATMLDATLISRKQLRGKRPKVHVSNYTGYGGANYLQETKKEQFDDFLGRAAMALFGGLALILPMLIMVLHQTRLTTLLTTSFFVLGVGLILAYFMRDADRKDILAATAAYAAVLVVFVGTSGTGS